VEQFAGLLQRLRALWNVRLALAKVLHNVALVEGVKLCGRDLDPLGQHPRDKALAGPPVGNGSHLVEMLHRCLSGMTCPDTVLV